MRATTTAEVIGTVIPNANSPQLLTHLLEMIARGVRSTRGLQEALGVDGRTVRYYQQAGQWLSFLTDDPEPVLSPQGLSYVYGGPARQELYVRSVLSQPFVAGLLQASGGRPTDRDIERAIQRASPQLAWSTVQRRTSAIRGLIAPALSDEAAIEEGPGQLQLPLAQTPAMKAPAPIQLKHGRSFNPEIYRYILCYLLDYGELTLGHVRGLLDSAGAQAIPIGGYIDLALQRGDAHRVGERLVVSRAAVERAEMAASAQSIILTDGGWRAHLEEVQRLVDKPRYLERLSQRYRLWDRRLFGHELKPEQLQEDLARVLRDRSIDSMPRTSPDVGPPPAPSPARPFLMLWERPDLLITLPPSLAQLWEGVAGLNGRLRNARHRTDAVGVPTLAYRPTVAHGGVIHPGELLPRAIADQRSIRQRMLTHVPYVTLIVAALYVHRTRDLGLSITHHHGRWLVRSHRHVLGDLLDVVDAFGRARGWVVSRRPRGGQSARVVMGLLERHGMVVQTDDKAMLHDLFFAQLRDDAEERELLTHLEPLASAFASWLQTQTTGDP